MSNFIQYIAEFIKNNYAHYEDVVVVLPSRRAEKYIQKELYYLHQAPFFSPKFETIDGFAKSLVEEQPVDAIDLLFRFYDIYKFLGHQEDFESFMNWAPMLIADCNEIDRYLVDANQLFKNLREVKEIENWSFGENRELSKSQKTFLEFWEQLKDYYQAINEGLAAEGLIYSGGLFKKAVLNLEGKLDAVYPKEQFIFAGFNALSEAELQLMNRLVKQGRAVVLAEADKYFLENHNHEAGKFIRILKERIPETKLFLKNKLAAESKDIQLISCAQSGSMLKVAQDILSKIPSDELDNTLLLLADESLIVPAIKHIPAHVGKANITLGLPLKLTPLRSWIELLFEFQQNYLYFKTKSLYHKSVISLFRHPFTNKLMTENDVLEFTKEEQKIISKNRIFLNLDLSKYSDSLKDLLTLVLQPWDGNFKKSIALILDANRLIYSELNPETDLIERSALFHFHDTLKALEQLFQQKHLPEMTLRTFEKFFMMRWMKESVAYYGNPIDGLQVMGLLETRLLSFDNIIVLGLNEGVMPPKNVINSLIPMDLRRFFGLPLPNDKEALFAHHFYRLLVDAKRLWIMHSTNQGDDISLAEASRYVKQIQLELAKDNPQIQLTESSYNLMVKNASQSVRFDNNEAARNRILDYFSNRGLSPSALNKFIQCPLDFYFRYVLKYGDEDDVEEVVESNTFGSVVHQALENLYAPFVSETVPLTVENVREMIAKADSEVEVCLRNEFETEKDHFERGEMYFAAIAAKKQVSRFLHLELRQLVENPEKTLYILGLEEELSHELILQIDGKAIPIKITGKIDRIDKWDGELRIIDYKTGTCQEKDVRINKNYVKRIREVDTDFSTSEIAPAEFKDFGAKHAMQLLFYLLLFYRDKGTIPGHVGIYSLRNLSLGLQSLSLAGEKPRTFVDLDASLVDFTEAFILEMAAAMLSIERFEHNPEAKYCKICE